MQLVLIKVNSLSGKLKLPSVDYYHYQFGSKFVIYFLNFYKSLKYFTHPRKWYIHSSCLILSTKGFSQTPLQLATPTQLQLVGVGVDFVFPLEVEGITPT